MSLAVEDLIADAVAAELNDAARPWATLPNEAVRGYDNVFKEAELATLQVVCIPLTLDRERLSRGGTWLNKYAVTIDFQRKLTQAEMATVATVESLNLIAQQVMDFYSDGHQLDTYPGWAALNVQRPLIFDAAMLWDQATFETYLELVFVGTR